MSERPPRDLSGLDEFRNWKPDAQQRALELLKERENASWQAFYCPIRTCDGNPHDDWTWQHARTDQRPPKWSDPWQTWLLMGGRGSGKTRTGSETTQRVTAIYPRLVLIAPTTSSLRETMVEGVSGLIATSPPGKRPQWEPSKKKLTWPNGCIGQGFTAEEPDRLRGPESGYIWADEPAHWPLVESAWDNALLGHRMKGARGAQPKVVATTTPKPTKWMKALVASEETIVHRVSTYANAVNLAEVFRARVLSRYEGTRLGRQELHGEILEDVEGALWTWEMLQWVEDAPPLQRIVIAIDPAGTANKRSDETGIIVLGIGYDKCLYVLADLSGRYSPEQWGATAWRAEEDFAADAIVYEKNYGGDMVRTVLTTTAPVSRATARLIPVTSRRGKEIRAEPIVALYEKVKVFHVGKRGDLTALEEEQTSWVPGQGPSPNRVDALVHGATELARQVMPAQVATPNDLFRPTRHLRAV